MILTIVTYSTTDTGYDGPPDHSDLTVNNVDVNSIEDFHNRMIALGYRTASPNLDVSYKEYSRWVNDTCYVVELHRNDSMDIDSFFNTVKL